MPTSGASAIPDQTRDSGGLYNSNGEGTKGTGSIEKQHSEIKQETQTMGDNLTDGGSSDSTSKRKRESEAGGDGDNAPSNATGAGNAVVGGLAKVDGENKSRKERSRRKLQMMIPQDRKTFFSIVSLLVSRENVSLLEDDLSASNFEKCIPPEHQALVQQLGDVLFFDC